MLLPNLVIIGAMKCGTVSLHEYLALHPQICMSSIDEVDFFIQEGNWSKGLDWYQTRFPGATQIVGERSTSYTKYPTYQGVPERMHGIIPDAKLIYNVRDPIRRIVSNYMHEVSRRRENRSFEAAFQDLNANPYVNYSKYHYQIEQYLKCYSPAQIFIISLEELSKNRQESLRRIFEFLEVDPTFTHPDFEQVHHTSDELKRPSWLKLRLAGKKGYARVLNWAPGLLEKPVERPVLSESLRQRLVDALQEDVNRLRAFTGQKFASWSL